MKKHNRRIAAALMALALPGSAFALDLTNTLHWPSTGYLPAYPAEPVEKLWNFSVSASAMRDDNFFRLSDGVNPQPILGTSDRAVTVGQIGAGVQADLPLSRQRILLDARVDNYTYSHFGNLGYTGYNAGAEWRWLAGENWRGNIGARSRKYQSSFSDLQAPVQDLITENYLFASAAYILTPRWRVRGAFDYYDYDHSLAARSSLNNHTTAFTAGFDYVTPAENSLGGQVKYTDGRYPNNLLVAATLVGSNFQEWETSGVAHWNVTGKTRLDARLGYTKRSYDQVAVRDFGGGTGRLDWDWYIAGKTLLAFAAWREIRSYQDVNASYVISKGIGIGPDWAPTAKLVFGARLFREDRSYRGDPGILLTGGTQREDKFTGLRLSVGYTPIRALELSAGFDTGKRDSNIVGRPFDYNAVSANARFMF
jgi:exopolysaccharide biosynthesis operon protein EpsL